MKRLIQGAAIAVLGLALCLEIAWGELTTIPLETKYGYSGEPRKLSCPPSFGATRYEWRMTHYENGTEEMAATDGCLLDTWAMPRIGHYEIAVRACNDVGCSDWLTSAGEGFWLFAWISPPEF